MHIFQSFSPKFELPVMDAAFNASKRVIVTCHFCHESGHKAANCHKLSMSARQEVLFVTINRHPLNTLVNLSISTG